METKFCKDCQTDKPLADFPKNKNGKLGLGTYCRKCQQVRTMSAPNYKTNVRKAQLKRNYGITLDKYDEILDRQHGRCAICKQLETSDKQYLSVDHNHETGAIRGLLCHNCNVGLGKFKDNQEYLTSAIWYLETYKQL